jgi:phosphatidylserine decarboxylase
VQTPPQLARSIAAPAWRITGVLAVLGLAALGLLPAGGVIGEILLILAAANLAFFRNPRRTIPDAPGLVVSPADGRVVEVTELADADEFVGRAQRVAIFLSVFNVHTNRAPAAGKVRTVRRRGGEYRAAFSTHASSRNAQLRIDLETASGARLGVVQITGLIARRILCYASEGDELERGDLYGLICYGSRVELILPATAKVRVAVGDRVRGGSSVIAEGVA